MCSRQHTSEETLGLARDASWHQHGQTKSRGVQVTAVGVPHREDGVGSIGTAQKSHQHAAGTAQHGCDARRHHDRNTCSFGRGGGRGGEHSSGAHGLGRLLQEKGPEGDVAKLSSYWSTQLDDCFGSSGRMRVCLPAYRSLQRADPKGFKPEAVHIEHRYQ